MPAAHHLRSTSVNAPPLDILLHWLVNTPELLQRACVVVVATYLAIRQHWFKRAMRGVDWAWRHRVAAAIYFGVLAIVGTHNGIVLDVGRNGAVIEYLSKQSAGLQPLQAILSFRDMLVLSAGLFGGPWTGLGAGLIAGGERWLLGGFVGFASGFSTLALGLAAGLAKQVWPNINCGRGTVAAVLAGTALQKALIVALSEPRVLALATIRETIIPETTVNVLGCLLFLRVMRDMERDRLQAQAQQAELRALRAQIEPHFINNTLNALKALIRRDPAQAAAYVVKLARFLDDTRQTASADMISLRQELAHLENYLDLQRVRFPDAFSFERDVPGVLLDCQIPPRSLLTLAENALLHGRRGHAGVLELRLTGIDLGKCMTLQFTDNGSGIAGERLALLGKRGVASERGSGNGLYQLCETLKIAYDGAAEVGIDSKENRGAEISLRLPKRSAA